ncbi:MAG: CinA family nicotinamide mononucleotide deamidase-related protein [Muribaculaceae bacterium]|nr:CinA family nicotinamide mononucleotide deamidase-related protein [Muribaculaceae bacterium]
MLKVAIIVIGDEILLGKITDTNTGAIARIADKNGFRVVSVTTVGDRAVDIKNAVKQNLENADIVFTTGGLGPTKDDITKTALMEIFGGKLVRDDSVTKNIENIFAGRNLKLNQLTLDQALVPDTAHIINNRFGTAPIMVFNHREKTLVAMPGVPTETEGMLPEVFTYLQRHFKIDETLRHETFVVTGMSESALAQALAQFEESLPPDFKLAYLPDSPFIRLRLDGPDNNDIYEHVLSSLSATLTGLSELTILATEDMSLAEIVIGTLTARNLTLSTAESCTGGNIAHNITSVSGSSAVFNGAVVSYANTAKINLLDVGKETIEQYGAVSRQVVFQMVDGACRALSTDCAIATSGIAGPTGGTPDKPVGTVWIAVKTPSGTCAQCYRFPGDRAKVIARATATGMIMLLQELRKS